MKTSGMTVHQTNASARSFPGKTESAHYPLRWAEAEVTDALRPLFRIPKVVTLEMRTIVGVAH